MKTDRESINRSEKGQSIVLVALSFVVLLAFVGLALDAGMLFMVRGKQQGATDAAAYAGALLITQTENWQTMDAATLESLATTTALEAANLNGFANDGKSNTIEVNYPPANGPYLNDKNYIQILIKTNVPTSFLQVISRNTMTSTTEAVVHITGAEGGQPIGGTGALIATNKTKCKSFYANNNAKINITGGGVFVNSNCSTGYGALYATGSAAINILTSGQGISVIGNYSKDNNGQISVTPVTGGSQKDFNDIDLPDCSVKSNFGSYASDTGLMNRASNYTSWQPTAYTLKPGVYPNGITVANGMAAVLQAGLYCVSGDVNFNGSTSITGNGVMFVMKGGSFGVSNGTNAFTLTAPNSMELTTTNGKSQNFAGMLFLANPSFYTTAKTYTYAGGATTKVTGTIYAPNINCEFNNGTSNGLYSTQVICNAFNFAGGSANNFKLDPSSVYQLPGGGDITIELAQ